jgi:DHA1 family multidrug resistance protein-like MFS transporter
MNKKQWLALCVCNIIIYAGIGGLVGLMPIYLTRLGADATITGFFLAVIYLSLALSNVISGQLSNRFQRRKGLLILGGVLAAPISWLMSQASSIGPLLILMAGLWFVIGIPMTMVNILAGLFSEAAVRGRNFGLLGLSAGFGLFLGGLVSGPVVDRWGFPALFGLEL